MSKKMERIGGFMRRWKFVLLGWFLCLVIACMAPKVTQAAVNEDGSVTINEENFPGNFFREYVIENIDNDRDGILSQNELLDTKVISTGVGVPDLEVADYKGIEYFENLEVLEILKYSAQGNYYSEATVDVMLDLSQNTKLKRLTCEAAELKLLGLSGLTQLEYVNISCDNCLSQNLSKLSRLKHLEINMGISNTDREPGSIILGDMPSLQVLDVFAFMKADIDFQKLPVLQEVHLGLLELKEINLSGNQELKSVELYGLIDIFSLQMHDCPKLKSVNIAGDSKDDNIPVVNLKNCPMLSDFYVTGTELTTVNLMDCPKLQKAYMQWTAISDSFRIIGGTEITQLTVLGGTIRELNLKDLKKLSDLNLGGTIKKILLHKPNSIQKLTLNSGVKTFDFTPYTKLKNLQIKYADVKKLDLRKNHKLKTVNCYWAQKLEKIQFSKKAKYRKVVIEKVPIKKIDIRKVKMEQLKCTNSKVQQLLAKGNNTITKLDVRNNQLTKLDLRGCKKLKMKNVLYTGNKKLTKKKIKK